MKLKFIWLYSAVLFSLALILIVISSYTNDGLRDELAFTRNASQGAQQAMTDLIKQNEVLGNENYNLTQEIEQLTEQLTEQENQNAFTEKRAQSLSALIKAQKHSRAKDTSAAREELEKIDVDLLDPEEKELYDSIKKTVD